MDRFSTFHIAGHDELRARDDFPHAGRYGNRIASRRWLADRFAGSPYRDGDVDDRQGRVAPTDGGDSTCART